jgi:hypothetical protein
MKPTMFGHTLHVFIDRDQLCAAIQCHEPEGASCRLNCPNGCESWPCEHELVTGSCNAVEWFGAVSVEECYGATDRQPVYDGMPVVVGWDGDGWFWTVKA